MATRQSSQAALDALGPALPELMGEDGPTHQPNEHLAALRVIPHIHVWRPCDGVEAAAGWQAAIDRGGWRWKRARGMRGGSMWVSRVKSSASTISVLRPRADKVVEAISKVLSN